MISKRDDTIIAVGMVLVVLIPAAHYLIRAVQTLALP